MTYRNRKLLDCAHRMPCLVDFPHSCTAHLGVEPMHSDQQIFGRGHGHKSPDWAFAAGCHQAHLDMGTFDRETKQAEWLRAFIKTEDYLWSNGMVKLA